MNKVLVKEYKTNSSKKTFNIGLKYGEKLSYGETILLLGEAGAGKTVFTKGLSKGLNITESVLSPTFAIRNDYEGRLTLHHLDMYRISDISELEETGVFEGIFGENQVSCIEWAENVMEYFDFPHTEINIIYIGEKEREIKIYKVE